MQKICISLMLAFILCFIVACQDKDAMAELADFKVQVKVEEQNTALAKRYIEAFNNGNFEAFTELLSSDYAIYSPSGYPQPTSREKLIENYKGAAEAFSGFTWNIEDIIAAEDKVICRIMARGTFIGALPDLPATEKKFEFSLITIMRIEDGIIVEEWQEDDQLGLARQLGMELKPKEGVK